MSEQQLKLTPEFCLIIAKVYEILDRDEKKVAFWMATKNPSLGYLSPLFLCKSGRAHRVLEFVNNSFVNKQATGEATE